MPTVLISGAANGLGAAFVEAYHTGEDTKIIAIDRSSISQGVGKDIQTFQVDIASEDSIKGFACQIEDQTIDLVIHSAGIRGLVPSAEDDRPHNVASCETIHVMDAATLNRAFQINAAGTFLLLRALIPCLQRASNPKVIVMSSRMGSIGNNERPNRDAGSAFAYRASKAACNAVVRSFAVDFPEIAFIMCHPGRVETKLVRCMEEGAISAEESVRCMLPLIESWNKFDSGKFLDRFGKTIQW